MTEPAIIDVAGLQTSNNTFSASPPGSLALATNIVINQKGVGQRRNGNAWNATLPTASALPFQLTEFQGQILANYAAGKTSTTYALGYVNTGSVTPYSGTYNPVGDDGVSTSYARMKFALASLFLNFCTTAGPKALEAYNGTPRAAGLPRMPDAAAWLAGDTAVPAGLVLDYNSSVAYRMVLRRPTSSGVSLLGPPSNRAVASNRWLAAAAGLVRTAGTTVTATFTNLPPNQQLSIQAGDVFTLSPGETDFPAGSYTVTGTSASGGTGLSITWASAGSNVSSTIQEDLNFGTQAVTVEAFLPVAAVAGDFLRFYRSRGTDGSSIDPLDDLYLCNEVQLASGDISAGHVTINDNTPQSVTNDPLYTNPTDGDGLGLPGENSQPPLYHDVVNWDGRTWYSNTVGQQSLRLQMLGIGSPSGIQDGDTLILSDGIHTTTFTFKNSPGPFPGVQIYSAGTPSDNIAKTCQFLTEFGSPTILANGIGIYADTAPDGFPGHIIFERWDFGPQFTVKVSRPASWTPGSLASTGTTSSNNTQPNALAYSKPLEAEAVPPINYLTVGASNFNIDRILGLRNSLLIFKEGDGIWSITGSSGAYNLQQISTANIIAPDACAVFADEAWVYTDQGILRVSDTGGITVISRPIETTLLELQAQFPDETFDYAFAVPYEVERRIMFFVPTSAAGSGIPDLQAYCYSLVTNTWTGPFCVPNQKLLSGVVSTAHRLWLGAYDSTWATSRITKERKDVEFTDFADGDWGNTLTTTANPLIISLATAAAIQVGTGISQTVGGILYRTKIAAVNGGGLYTVAETVPWANAACTVFDPYPSEIQFNPSGTPASRQVLTRMATLYKPEEFANYFGVATIETDQMPAELEVGANFLGFGLNPFGKGPFGNPSPQVVDTNPIGPQWTNAGQFYPGFKLDEVWTALKLQGVYLMIERAGAPVARGK